MSSTRRDGFWDNNLDAPFTKASNKVEVPGPGKYAYDKKKSDVKAKILQEDAQHPGFHSSKGRYCLRKDMKDTKPGPGQYIDISNPHHSSVCKNIINYFNDRGFAERQGVKLGPFGSKEDRFENNYFKSKDGPGPGEYEEAQQNEESQKSLLITGIKTRQEGPKQAPATSIFASKTNRFVDSVPTHPQVRIIKQKGQNKSMDLGIYNTA